MLCFEVVHVCIHLLLAHCGEVVLPCATNLVDEMLSGFTKSEPWLKDWGDKGHPKSGEQTRPFHQRDAPLVVIIPLKIWKLQMKPCERRFMQNSNVGHLCRLCIDCKAGFSKIRFCIVNRLPAPPRISTKSYQIIYDHMWSYHFIYELYLSRFFFNLSSNPSRLRIHLLLSRPWIEGRS